MKNNQTHKLYIDFMNNSLLDIDDEISFKHVLFLILFHIFINIFIIKSNDIYVNDIIKYYYY